MTESTQRKQDWYLAESIACEYLQGRWYYIIERNYTIRWGELDIISSIWDTVVFVEVKLVNHVLDIHDYITPTKLKHLYKTIEYYMREHRHNGDIQLDVIFVRYDQVIQHVKNITGER